jgi:hypothetical protein
MNTDSVSARLRRANPVPDVRGGENADLFERITALPTDPRLTAGAERRPPLRRPVVVFALALALMALLASTAFAVSQWIGSDVVRTPVTRQEYLDAQPRLTLPPGATWPPFHPGPDPGHSVTVRGAGGGMAVLIAQNAWECYWVDALRSGDKAGVKRADAELGSLLAHNVFEAPVGAPEGWVPTPFPSVPFVAYAHDGGLDWIRHTYAQAAAGNPKNLIQSCKANAPE